jgi:hypothetical protein
MRVRGRGCLRRQAALLVAACGILTACSGNGPAATSVAGRTVLTCQDSAGHVTKDPGARWVGGVGSPALYGGFPASSLRLAGRERSKDGHLYLSWKDPVAVAPSAGPYRTITVVTPPSARLLFASPSRWATLTAVLPVLPRSVRLSACGRNYSSYFGAIMVRRWACVTLAVTGPAGKLGTVTVPIGVAQC